MFKALFPDVNDPASDRLCRVTGAWERPQTIKKCGRLEDYLSSLKREYLYLFYAGLHHRDSSRIDVRWMTSQHHKECQTAAVSALKNRPSVESQQSNRRCSKNYVWMQLNALAYYHAIVLRCIKLPTVKAAWSMVSTQLKLTKNRARVTRFQRSKTGKGA